MRFKMFKNLAAMMMCAAFAAVSCLPVSAAEQACSHSHTITEDYGYGVRLVESGFCGDCPCAYCPAEFTYRAHYLGLVCADCDKLLKVDTIWEYESHTCSCTTCECVCGYN